jgi:HEPN domain-containing protein
LHLAIEKIIKAHVCKKISDVAPRSHRLLKLLEQTGLQVLQADKDFIAELSLYNIEGRYPDIYEELPPEKDVARIRQETERIYQWLLNQF